MKKILTLFFLFQAAIAFSQQDITNQNLFDTTTFMEEHYAVRVGQFKNEHVETGKIIFLGDSITEGGQWRKLLDNDNVINRGISGDVTFGVLKRLDDIMLQKPAKIFILIGVNDIGKDIPDEVIVDNCRKIVKRLQEESPSTEIYVQSILPVNPAFPGFPQHYDKEYHIIHTNHLLQMVAKKMKCHFINLFPVFMDKQQRLSKELSYDGLHLNGEGYAVWVKYLRDMRYIN